MRWTLFLIVAGLVLPASAPAATSPPAHVRLTECGTGEATFEGDMRSVRGSARLLMRFTLQVRADRDEPWKRVPAAKLDTWAASNLGKLRYLYDKHVEGLVAPGEYRMRVRFRWLDAAGHAIAQTRRDSRVCRQRDPRPDLQLTGVRFEGGWYLIGIRNAGLSAAPAFDVTLTLPGAEPVRGRVDALAANGRTTLSLGAPKCEPGSTLQVVIDAADEVDEATESDDAVPVPCPAQR